MFWLADMRLHFYFAASNLFLGLWHSDYIKLIKKRIKKNKCSIYLNNINPICLCQIDFH